MKWTTCVSILEVWTRLGGGPLRGHRGRAWWRGGDGYSVSLDADHARWFDHARGTGGGVLALVETALGIDRRAALKWLGENFGIVTAERTPEERRRYAQRIDAARAMATEICARRDEHLLDLRTAAGLLLGRYHELLRIAHVLGDIDLLARAESIFAKLDELAARRDKLRAATGPELVEFFRAFERRAA